MSFKYLKKVIDNIKKLDFEVNSYQKVVRNPYIPSLAYVNWAMHLAEQGKFEEAEEKLLYSTQMAHQTPESYINLGVLKTRERKFADAKKFYIKAIRLDNNNAKAFCFLGNILTEMQDYDDAEKKYEHALKLSPCNSDVMLNWGVCFLRQRKFAQAKEKFSLAFKYNASNFSALYFLALVDVEFGDNEKAKEKFKLITSVQPKHHDAFYYLAYLYYKDKNYNESLACALKSVEIFDKKIETYMLISENYMNLGNEAECFKYYELGEKESAVSYYFLISWGISLEKFNYYEQAGIKFEKAVELEPQNELAYAYLGTLYYKMNEYYKATSSFQKTLEINPQNTVALDNLGQINFDQENYVEAIKYFGLVLKYNAKSVENYGKIAQAYFLEGNIQKANAYYQKALEYQPESFQVHINYAKILVEQSDFANALKKLEKANKLEENNSECLNLLFYVNYMLAKENLSDYNIERAMKIAQKIENDYPESFFYRDEKKELETKLGNRA